MRFVYTFFMWAIQPLLRRKLLRRGCDEPGYLEAIEERFGHYSQPAQTHAELLWVHAVSLGETRAAAVLIEALRAQQPALRVLRTHRPQARAKLTLLSETRPWHGQVLV